MISAVVPPQALPSGPLPQPPTVRERAAAGYFRDIALWLNQPLAPHGIFVQVQAERPGCLRLVVEFQQQPIKDHLLRFLCHRLWLLNSELIEGIYVVARPLGHRRVLWEQRIKIVTPALKQSQQRPVVKLQRSQSSTMPPKIRPPRPSAKGLSRQHLQTLRAFVLSGSAVAAFVMGCLLEIIISSPSPSLPQFSAQSEVRSQERANRGEGTPATQPSFEVGARESVPAIALEASTSAAPLANRPTVVDTVLEPVGVITHQKSTPIPSNDVTLLFGGDISLDDIAPDTLDAPGGFFADVAEYSQADLALVNLATPLATAATNLEEEFRQKTRADAVDLLVNSGVDIVNLTHSRLMDYGAAGLDETITTLDSKGLYRIGAGRNAMEARRPEVLDVKGKRIAYLSYAMGGNNAAHDDAILKERAGADNQAVAKEVENFKAATAFKNRAGFNAQDMPEIVADIQALRNDVDWIVVNFRWVDHLSETPNFMQTNLARLAIDQGADVVVGYHPTVIQGGEIYKGRPIAYSLGDFVFRPDDPIENQDSAVLKVSLKDDQMQIELVPVRVRDSRPKTLTGPASESVLQRIEQASSQFDQPLKSPVLLDLKTPELPPETVSDPNSPFVSPEAEEVLPVELEPKQNLQPESLVEPDSSGDDIPVDPSAPTPSSEAEEPAVLPELEVEFDGDLKEWGPKVSPEQREFQPVPPQRSGGDAPSAPAGNKPSAEAAAPKPQPQPHLWGEEPVAQLAPLETLQQEAPPLDASELKSSAAIVPSADSLEPTVPLAPVEATTWTDTVPDSPVLPAED
ncbi:CapA family protein [Nodosilinea sp. E11]|uniref:CapA family protein n=1 Tax=Nodosilinea sp. E11 TaxID=3037479 RepID=UPI002934FD3E|nr:CapA family protein [Nodosilinea sp. E11]WOD39332.1 CapA family protein [Nodosilinea sp. E11]